MPILIALLIIIVLLLGGWWIFAIAIGAVAVAVGLALAAVAAFLKVAWPYLLGGFGLFLLLGIAGLIVEARAGKRLFRPVVRTSKQSAAKPLPPLVRSRSKPGYDAAERASAYETQLQAFKAKQGRRRAKGQP